MAFPSNILSLADAIGSQFLSVLFGGSVSHSSGLNQMKADLVAVETKLGTGASTAAANTVLRGTGTGTSAFGQIVSADITDGTIVDADINASAAIAVSKLAAGANKTVLTSNGTTNSMATSVTLSGSVTAEAGLNAGTTGAGTGEVKTSGAVKAGAGVYPSGQATAFSAAPVVTTAVAAGGTATVGTSGRDGFVLVTDHTQGKKALFTVDGGFNTTVVLAGDVTYFGTSIANNSKIHLSISGGNYVLYNGYPASHTLSAWFIGT